MKKTNKNFMLKSGWRLYSLLAALFLVMAGCGPDPFFVQVVSVEDVPETGTAGRPLVLTGNVRPGFASNRSIIWLVDDAGTTGANISGNVLYTAASGTAIIRAIIANGIAEGKDFTQDFEIVFSEGGSIGIQMVSIPAGTFTMGQAGVETPEHPVTLTKSFYMGKYQVTQAQWTAVMGADEDRAEADFGKGDNYPAYYVSWYDAITFCNKLSVKEGFNPVYIIGGSTVVTDTDKNGYRLPTEAEWEYACRAGTTTAYNTGDTISDNTGWYNSNSGGKTHEVGLKPANARGLHDMHGNVHEWCWDWHSPYSDSPADDPSGPVSGTGRVLRGGGCYSSAGDLYSAYRFGLSPDGKDFDIGFRVVRTGANTPNIPVTGVSLNKNTLTLTAGSNETLTATVAPANATNKNVTWGSGNTAVATVDSGGKVTAVGVGTTDITVTTSDGNKTATCTVTVQAAGINDARIAATGEETTLADALTKAANGSLNTPAEIIILRNITAVQNGNNNYAYSIPAKHIKLTVLPGQKITITANAGNFSLFNVSNTGSSLTLGPTTGGGELILSGGNAPAQTDRRGVYVKGATLNINSGVTITGFNNNAGDVFVSNNGSSGLISLSGNATIDTLTLGADSGGNAVAEIASDWSAAYIGKLNFYGGGNTIESVIGLWKDRTVLQGGWLNASNIENMNFKLWNFIDSGGHTQRINTPQPPAVPYGYMIGDSVGNMGKLIVATFNIYLEARRYGEASTDTEIIVPYDYVMPRPLTIPAPGASGITLTIKGNAAERKVTRGTQDINADNGLFIVPSGVQLIFESIVIDGNKAVHTGNTASLVRVNAGGRFTMNAGAVLQNNRAADGGGVYVVGGSSTNGTFTMSGGDIKNNTATSSGGGVYVGSSGTFTMSGGTINGNTAASGGGVYVNNNGTFTMSGGGTIISGNTANGTGASNGGGGVYAYFGTFTMNSGTISGNTATTSGGGVYVTGSGGTFTMNNGTISGNTASGTGATNGGGGVYVSSGTFNMYGGVINGGNKAAGNGGGVYTSGTFRVGGTAKVSGNTKTNNSTNNVYLPSTYITLGAAPNAPASGMDISVQTARDDGVIAQPVTNGTVAAYFKADEAGKTVVFDIDALVIK